jgi:hypothetical protein
MPASNRPISAIHTSVLAPGQCIILNINVRRPIVITATVKRALNFSKLVLTLISKDLAIKVINKMPAPEPLIRSTFAPGQWLDLNNIPKSRRRGTKTAMILIVRIMAILVLVKYKTPAHLKYCAIFEGSPEYINSKQLL